MINVQDDLDHLNWNSNPSLSWNWIHLLNSKADYVWRARKT
jgi:hypothetical protein